MLEGKCVIGISEEKEARKSSTYCLHAHDDGPEIMLFLEGDAKMLVEEKVYSVEPYDLFVIKKGEMHCFYRHIAAPYRRIIVGFDYKFLVDNHCEKFVDTFCGDTKNSNHKIPGEVVKAKGILDAFMRYEKYSKSYTLSEEEPELKAVFIEILYLIYSCTEYGESEPVKDSMKPIIVYLNEHYAKNITLDQLCKQFFISKSYLCKAFQKSTGLSVFEYIRKKRFAKVRELRLQGMNISEAAVRAGFTNYTAYYRAYKKEYGKPPKKDLR